MHPQKYLLSTVGFIINDELGLAASFTQGSSFAFGLIRTCSSTARVAGKYHPRQGVKMPQKPSGSQGAKWSRETKQSQSSLHVSRPLKLTPGAGEDVQSTDETLHPACPIPAGSGRRS